MAPQVSKATELLPTSTPKRGSSPELGSPSINTQYNKQTGRPIRKSAGKARRLAGYVNPEELVSEDDEHLDSSSDESADEMVKRAIVKATRKRKRSPSPPSPTLEPIIYEQEPEELTDEDEIPDIAYHIPKKSPVTLQFNVPLGFHGPLFVELDGTLLKDVNTTNPQDIKLPDSMITPVVEEPSDQVRQTGFTDLPPELRNTVYRLVFITHNDIWVPQRSENMNNMGRSAQFLRTCKMVHNEGCSILYGENTFSFARTSGTRGPFWVSTPTEIGYKDALQFLKMIGPENLQYLRSLRLSFDDAAPKDTPYYYTANQRRFLNDDILINCLRILRKAKLRKLYLAFYGRRQLQLGDTKFLSYLEQIKTDELHRNPPRCYIHEKLGYGVWPFLSERMIRSKKLYEKP